MSEQLRIAYYARDIQHIFWVKCLQELTGGPICTEVRGTYELLRERFPQTEAVLAPTPHKLTVGRRVGTGKLTLKRKQVRLGLHWLARELEPDVIVNTANHDNTIHRDLVGWLRQGCSTFARTKQVQAFHDISSKDNRFRRHVANHDLLLLCGPRTRDGFERIGVLERTRWTMVGLCKSDPVFDGRLRGPEVLAEMGLAKDRPTVIYAPTHGALSSFHRWGRQICQAIGEEYNLIVTLHPYIAIDAQQNAVAAEALRAVEADLQERRNAVFFPSEADAVRVMCPADVMVTDYSSLAEEFLMFDRPLVIFDHLAGATGRDAERRRRLDIEAVFPAAEVTTEVGEIARAVDRALTRPQEKAAERQRLRDYIFYKLDGKASERAVAAIHELREASGGQS